MAVERNSEHPLAAAIVAAAVERGLELAPVRGFDAPAGKGVIGMVERQRLALGNAGFLRELNIDAAPLHEDAERQERRIALAKGAPDILLGRCSHELVGEEARPLTAERRAAILKSNDDLAEEALRTLGVAFRSTPGYVSSGDLNEQTSD